MFDVLSSVFTTNNDFITLPQSSNTEVLQQSSSLDEDFERAFLEHKRNKLDLIKTLFRLLR